MTQSPLLAAKGLTKNFGAVVACAGVDLDLASGEIHALIGPNGAGKTTLVGQLAGEVRPDRGQVLLDGTDITGLDPVARARAGIARSYQVSTLFDEFTAAQNVEVAIQGRQGRGGLLRNTHKDRPLRDEALNYLGSVGAQEIGQTRVADLAHGQKRQVEIAMVLAMRPRIVLLDEPMAGLGRAETRAMVPLIADLGQRHGVLLIEHDMDVVFELANRVSVLVAGKIVASGAPDAVRADSEVRRVYLNEPG
ncbi:MAG: ABC transporter ATP-binding protein [Alphaproteobacteria bacterium]